MRWLVFFLIVLNGLMVAWFSFQERGQSASNNAEAVEHVFSASKRLLLTTELAEGELARRDQRKPEPVKAEVELMCIALGAFPEVVSARQIAGRLLKHDITAKLVLMQQELPPVHWVYIEPSATREKSVAILKKLQAKRIDSFLVGDGEYANAISLGYFSKIESARSVMEAQIDAGYKAHAILKTRTEEAYFLTLNVVDSVKFSTDLLENIQLENKDLKKHEKVCKALASLQSVQ